MWYSSSAYHILPNLESPVPHFCSEKSSVNDAGSALMLVLRFGSSEFVFVFVLVLRSATRFALLLLSLVAELRLASAMIITTRPTPMIARAANPPRIHQIAFDF